VKIEPPTSTSPNAATKAAERGGLGRQRVGDPREHVAEAALEQRSGIAANECRNENRRPDERHEQQQLEVVCAANWITTTGQLAAASSAPRFSRCFRSTSISL
jgi:hypothetical protein